MNQGFLDEELIRNFRNVINSTNIFCDGNQKDKFNLICAVMDRIDTCVRYLNNHDIYPDSEESFITFFVYGAMIKDAVYQLSKSFTGEYPSDNTSLFAPTFQCVSEYNHSVAVSDDKYFEYMRSLVFAHPIETSRAKFLRPKEVQYSPWVIVGDAAKTLLHQPDGIGIRIYSNLTDDSINLLFPFRVLKEYIRTRYENMNNCLKWAQNEISKKKNEWKAQKINRLSEPNDILREIKSILESRYESTAEVEQLIHDLTCPISVRNNKKAVEKYRTAIISALPDICDSIESLQDIWGTASYKWLTRRPKKMHQMASYQLEKINSYLRLDRASSNYRFGIMQADAFADEFAKNWVEIDTASMDPEEIQFLTRVACFLEAEEQERG